MTFQRLLVLGKYRNYRLNPFANIHMLIANISLFILTIIKVCSINSVYL